MVINFFGVGLSVICEKSKSINPLQVIVIFCLKNFHVKQIREIHQMRKIIAASK